MSTNIGGGDSDPGVDATLDEVTRADVEPLSLLDVQRPPDSLSRYVLEGLVGRGGVGAVYAAYDPELDRRVAIKVLQARTFGGEDSEVGLGRLLREAQAIAKISHPNVVAVHDVGSYSDPRTRGRGVFIVMELLDGLDGQQWLEAAPRPWTEVLSVFLAAGEGLSAAHKAGMVHRDFKPANILVADDGRVRVLDFGLARALQGSASASLEPSVQSAATCEADDLEETQALPSDAQDRNAVALGLASSLTRTGVVVGTPRYMAPEHHRGGDVDARADQFGYCAALHVALYRTLPFAGETIAELAAEKRHERLRPVPEDTDVPAWLRAVVVRGLRADPDDRFSDMAALLDALRNNPESARPPRRRWGPTVAAIAVATGLGIAIGSDREEGPAPVPPAPALEPERAEPEVAEVEARGIAVVTFHEATGDPRLDFAASGLPSLLVSELQQIRELPVFETVHLQPHVPQAPTPEDWRAAARRVGAQALVRGQTVHEDGRVVLRVWVDALDTGVTSTLERTIEVEEAPRAIRMMAQRVANLAIDSELEFADAEPRDFAYDRHLQLAIAALGEQRWDAAEEHLGPAEVIDPQRGEVQFYRALLAVWNSRTVETILDHVHRALQLELSESQRAFLIGLELQVSTEYARGLEHFDRELLEYPREYLLHYGRFECLFHAGRPAEAVEAFARMVELKPTFTLGSVHPMMYYAAHGQVDALTELVELLEVSGRAEDEGWDLRLHMARGEYQQAVDLAARDRARYAGSAIAADAVLGRTSFALETARQRDQVLIAYAVSLAAGLPDTGRERSRAIAHAIAGGRSFSAATEWITLATVELPFAEPKAIREIMQGLDSTLLPEFEGSQYVIAARTLLQARLDDEAALQAARESEFAQVRAIAEAALAERRGDDEAAARAWTEAIAFEGDGRFMLLLQWRLATVRARLGEHAAVLDACAAVALPRLFDWSWGSLVAPCLHASALAHRAVGDEPAAADALARLVRIRALALPDDLWLVAAQAAGQE